MVSSCTFNSLIYYYYTLRNYIIYEDYIVLKLLFLNHSLSLGILINISEIPIEITFGFNKRLTLIRRNKENHK